MFSFCFVLKCKLFLVNVAVAHLFCFNTSCDTFNSPLQNVSNLKRGWVMSLLQSSNFLSALLSQKVSAKYHIQRYCLSLPLPIFHLSSFPSQSEKLKPDTSLSFSIEKWPAIEINWKFCPWNNDLEWMNYTREGNPVEKLPMNQVLEKYLYRCHILAQHYLGQSYNYKKQLKIVLKSVVSTRKTRLKRDRLKVFQ